MNVQKLIAVYNNSQLNFFVLGIYKKKTFVLFEKEIKTFTIEQLQKNTIAKEIRKKLELVYQEVVNKFELRNKNIELIISPESFYFKDNDYKKEFEEMTVVNQEDVLRLKKYAINFEEPPRGYQMIDFLINQKYLDNKPVNNLVGKSGMSIELSGNIIIADKETVLNIKNLFASAEYNVTKVHILEYYLHDQLKTNGDAIIIVDKQQVKFMTSSEGNINNFTVKTGTIAILGKIYDVLVDVHGPKKSETIVRELQKKWILKQYPHEYDIINGVNINTVIESSNMLLFQFFDYIFKEVKKQNITLKKVQIISEEIDGYELAEFLNESFDMEFKGFDNEYKYISELMDSKVSRGLKKIYTEGG